MYKRTLGQMPFTIQQGVQLDNNEPDNIYWNINVTNNSDQAQPMRTYLKMPDQVIGDGKMRYFSIMRLVIDGTSIPKMLMDPGRFFVGIRINPPLPDVPVLQMQEVIYDPAVVQGGGNYPDRHPIFNYQSFVDMWNVAYQLAWDSLPIVAARALLASPPLYAPKFLYDSATGSIGFAVQQTYANPDLSQPAYAEVIMNNQVYNCVPSFHANLKTERDLDYASLIIRDYFLNREDVEVVGPPSEIFLKIKQEYSTLYNWFDITNISLISGSLPITQELTPTINLTDDNIVASSAGSGSATQPIVTDFQPSFDFGDFAGVSGYLYYTPSVYRLIDVTNNSIDQVDINIVLKDRQNREYTYFLPSRQTMYIKMLLVKKSLYKSKNT